MMPNTELTLPQWHRSGTIYPIWMGGTYYYKVCIGDKYSESEELIFLYINYISIENEYLYESKNFQHYIHVSKTAKPIIEFKGLNIK